MEVAVLVRKLAYTVHFTSHKAVDSRRRQSCDRKDIMWPQVTESDPKVTSYNGKSPRRGGKGPKTGIYCTFHFLQGCSSQEEAVT